MAKNKKLNEDDLIVIIDRELAESTTYNNKVGWERAEAFKYFNSELYGNETKGRSSYVSSEVLETITWAMPQIRKIFSTNDSIVKFDPISPETVDEAELATQYCEFIFNKQNTGSQILHNMVFDALLQKNGVVKVYYDTTIDYIREDYQDLDDAQADQLLSQPGVEPIDRDTTEHEIPGVVPDEDGNPSLGTFTHRTHNLSIKRPKKGGQGKIRIENVPPEELIVSRLARSMNLDECPFVAQKVKKTISWLREQGYEVEDDVADGESYNVDWTPELIERRAVDGNYWPTSNEALLDPSQRLVQVVEAYFQVDYDGDGIAEWRKVTKIGETVLDNVECYYQPFISTSPMPMPHKYYGMSMAEMVMDLQYLKSLIMRAMLDSFAFNINPARAVNAAAVIDINDLLDTDPGAWIKLRGEVNNNLMTLPSAGIGAEAFQLLEYVDNIAESRSGVSRYTQGIDNNSFNKTATGTQAIMNASQEKLAMITRIIAETGIAEIYKKILKVASTYVTSEQLIRCGEIFVSVDPRKWMDLETLTINVGTGALDTQADMAQTQQISQLQTALLQSGKPDLIAMVDAQKVFNANAALLKAMGKKNIADYFNAPQSPQYAQVMQQIQEASKQPPPVDPVVQATQIQTQQAAQKAQQDAMIKSAEFELRVRDDDRNYELRKLEMELKYQVEMEKLKHKFNEQELNAIDTGVNHELSFNQALSDRQQQEHEQQQAELEQIHNSGFNQQGK